MIIANSKSSMLYKVSLFWLGKKEDYLYGGFEIQTIV